jgi:DNA-3-methyladenine glycosylase II
VLAGRAPRLLLERVAARLFGLDHPARALSRHLPDAVRRATARLPGATLPGYPTLFEALVHTILGQQISATAANVHRAAFTTRFGRPFRFQGGTYWTFPATADVAGERLESLRRPGLSTVKALAVRSIARAIENATISEGALEAMPPESAIGTLTELPGIGRWTAEWVLLRALRRFDIVPAGDLAVRKAVTWFARRPDLLSETEVRDLVAPWTPYAGLIAFRLLLAHRQAVA